MKFLKENWLWIAIPVVAFALAVTALVLFGEDGGNTNPYDIR